MIFPNSTRIYKSSQLGIWEPLVVCIRSQVIRCIIRPASTTFSLWFHRIDYWAYSFSYFDTASNLNALYLPGTDRSFPGIYADFSWGTQSSGLHTLLHIVDNDAGDLLGGYHTSDLEVSPRQTSCVRHTDWTLRRPWGPWCILKLIAVASICAIQLAGSTKNFNAPSRAVPMSSR